MKAAKSIEAMTFSFYSRSARRTYLRDTHTHNTTNDCSFTPPVWNCIINAADGARLNGLLNMG